MTRIGILVWSFLLAVAQAQPEKWGFEVVESYPQDRNAFTQGLCYDGESLVLGTGLHGSSSLRIVDLKSGKTVVRRDLDRRYFGEGVTRHGDMLYQLTWKAGVAFAYDAKTLQPLGSARYRGEGWGLCSDGEQLIMSDGTSTLTGRDPKTFAAKWTMEVTRNGEPVRDLNELEYINGRIYANVYEEDVVLVIHPETGVVEAVIDFAPLVASVQKQDRRSGVLNGLAWDARRGLLLVTGKTWNRLFAIRLGKQ